MVFDFTEFEELIGRKEGVGRSGLSGAAGASDAVDVVLRKIGHGVVDHVAHISDVDAAGEHVGGDKHVDGSLAEIGQGTVPFALGFVGVDAVGADVGVLEPAGAGVGGLFGTGEDDDPLGALFLEQRDEQLLLLALGDGEDVLVDGVGRIPFMGDLDDGRIVLHEVSLRLHVGRERCAEQERLALGGKQTDDRVDRRPETHVRHAVDLVEHEVAHLPEGNGVLAGQVDKSAGRGDQEIAALLELLDLGGVLLAADDELNAQTGRFGEDLSLIGDLLSQLTRGGEDEGEGSFLLLLASTASALRARTLLFVAFAGLFGCGLVGRGFLGRRLCDLVDDGKKIGEGFPRAGLGGGEDVATGEADGDGCVLHLGGLDESLSMHGFEKRRAESQ